MIKHILSFIVIFVSQLSYVRMAHAQTAERPPQYVLLAFDGSLNLDFWRESREFAKSMIADGKPLHFTYFISGVYFLANENKNVYDAPKKGRGRSDIGFGGPIENIAPRVQHLNQAFDEGHEMGSHANGHFSAKNLGWDESDWKYEFSQFEKLIFDVFSLNKIPETVKWSFSTKDVQGFRAPLLSMTEGLWPTLKNFGFKYDTSKSDAPNYWPQRNSWGLWNFPLARLPIVGTGKKTLSMDYNFYVAQSGGKDDSKNKELYKKQMLNSYLKYFQDNYNGNRAPIHIGHHFSKWNGGAYWEAMKDFAKEVCGRAEVKCVTYKEYMDWLERQSDSQLASYKAGQFPRTEKLALAEETETVSVETQLALNANNEVNIRALTSQKILLKTLVPKISINGRKLKRSAVSLNDIHQMVPRGSNAEITAHLYTTEGVEVSRATQTLENVGLETERLNSKIQESDALIGDLPEAHLDEE